MGNIFSQFVTVKAIALAYFLAGESVNPSRKCTPNSKRVLITHTEWQLNEVQLKCPLVHERMPKLKKWGLPGLWKKQAAVLGFSGPVYSFNVQPLFTHLSFPDPGADRGHVTRTSGQQKSGSEGSFVQKENRLHFVAAAFSWKWTRAFWIQKANFSYGKDSVFLSNQRPD